MKKYVINLKRRPDRLENFKTRFSNFVDDIQVVYGFDGKNFFSNPVKEQEMARKCFNLNRGEMGCALSHFRIYQDIIDNYDYGLIFEDDAMPSDNFNEKINNVLKDFKEIKDCDILFFGGRFTPNFMLEEPEYMKVSDNIMMHNIKLWKMMKHERTTHGYIISKKLAKFLLDKFENEGMKCAMDNWFLQAIKNNNFDIYNSNPLLCYSPFNNESDIR
jgi:glycosyl transferase family 25